MSTTLVEVTPGVAVVFGEVPEGLELIGLDMLPSAERAQLSTVLGSLGDFGTITGNLAEAASSAQGLFRVNEATLALLKSGGQMATKDGAKLGAIFKNGKLVGQARFLPAPMAASAAIAAIGPAIAMVALQMQLGEISSLVRANIQLTTQTLKSIRNEQWAELEGLAESVGEAVKEARDLDAITDSVWEPIGPSGPDIRKQLKLYRKHVAGHIRELGLLGGRARRQYLETNAEAIVFDTYALLSSLKTYAEYQVVRAALARKRSANDENDAQLFNRITRTIPGEIDRSLSEISSLTGTLVRELRIIAELPGRATAPLTRKRKDVRASQFTCAQLLEAIDPLASTLKLRVETPTEPMTVCAPEELEFDRYLQILRWYLEEGETLRAVAFPYELGTRNVADVVPAILAKRVDATWDALAPGRGGAIIEKFATSTFVAVTDRRIITATPSKLLRLGELGPVYSLDSVRNVRRRSKHGTVVRPSIDVATEECDLHWMFPDAASSEDIDSLASLLAEGTSRASSSETAVEAGAPFSSMIED